MAGLYLSLILGIATAVITTAIGTAAAVALLHLNKGVGALRALHMAPLVTPGVVTGLAILIYLSSLGLRGSFWTLLAGHVVLTIPFVVMIVSAGLQSFDRALEEAAISLGASPIVAFFTVTLPVVKTAVISAAMFTFLHSFDEVVVTLFLPGPRLRTLPVQMFDYVQFNLDPLPAAISTVLIAIALIVIVVGARLGGLGRLLGGK